MTSKFLTALKPFMYIMPECAKPERKVTFREKTVKKLRGPLLS